MLYGENMNNKNGNQFKKYGKLKEELNKIYIDSGYSEIDVPMFVSYDIYNKYCNTLSAFYANPIPSSTFRLHPVYVIKLTSTGINSRCFLSTSP